MTTYCPIVFFGADENSEDKSGEEHSFPSGKGRKKPFSAEGALINAFGSRMPGVRVPSLRPKF